MKRFLFFAAFAAAALVSCNKAEVETPKTVSESSRTVEFVTENFYSFDTKAAMAASSHIGIYATAPAEGGVNADYTVGAMPTAEPAVNGTLTGSAIKWGVEQVGTATTSTFFAIYPYENEADRNNFDEDTDIAYTITDASSDAGSLEYARDFMVARTVQSPGADVENPNKVTFNFTHPFAMLRYVITNTSDDAIRDVKISGVHTSGNLAFATAAITPSGDAQTAFQLAQESVVDNVLTFYVVIVPEENINPTITISTWSGATSSFSLSASRDFVAGKKYTAAITYNHTHTVVTSNRTAVADFTVSEWAEENVTAGVEAGYSSDNDNWPVVRGEGITGSSWDGGLPMSCIGQNSYRKVITLEGDGTHAFKVYKASGLWYGVYSTQTVDDWSKVVTTTGASPNVTLTGDADDTFTVYYYSDNNEIWFKAGDVTR